MKAIMERQNVHEELEDIADALLSLASQIRPQPLRDGLTNAHTLVRATLLDGSLARQPALLGLAMRFLREFEKAVGDDPLTGDARRLRERLAPFLADGH
jgi:hypothetical protein